MKMIINRRRNRALVFQKIVLLNYMIMNLLVNIIALFQKKNIASIMKMKKLSKISIFKIYNKRWIIYKLFIIKYWLIKWIRFKILDIIFNRWGINIFQIIILSSLIIQVTIILRIIKCINNHNIRTWHRCRMKTNNNKYMNTNLENELFFI